MRTDVVPFVVCSMFSVADQRASNTNGNSFSVLNQGAIAVPISSGESPWPLVSAFDSNFRLRWPSAAELAVRRLHYPGSLFHGEFTTRSSLAPPSSYGLRLPGRVPTSSRQGNALAAKGALLWRAFDAVPAHSAPSRATPTSLDRKSTRLNSSHQIISYA